MNDNVNNPTHYNKGGVECIAAIESMLTAEEFIGYLRGNSLKYRWRFRYKNGIEDLYKARWYEDRLINYIEKTGCKVKEEPYLAHLKDH
jgi:hypothetical protein